MLLIATTVASDFGGNSYAGQLAAACLPPPVRLLQRRFAWVLVRRA
jgi:hypothetical protein